MLNIYGVLYGFHLSVYLFMHFMNYEFPFPFLILRCIALPGVLPKYFNSEWSVAQFHLHEGSHYAVAFGLQKNTVLILGMDGRYDV